MFNNDSNFLTAYRYCPKCGQPMQPANQGGSLMPTCTSQKCKYIFWQNAKPCVVAVIKNEYGQVLMTERGIEPDKGKLDLPGGFMMLDEQPDEAARRETREELGIEVQIIDFLGVEIDKYFYQNVWETTLVLGFTARIIEGEPHRRDEKEIARIEWIDIDNIKSSQLAFTCNQGFLNRLRTSVLG